MYSNSSDKLVILIIFFIGINLLTTGSVTWSVWPAGILLLFYVFSFKRSEDRALQEVTLIKERFAKGEISEEDFIRQRKIIEEDRFSMSSSGLHYFAGIILMALGVILVFRNLFSIYIPWLPIILIAVGLYSIFRNLR